MLNKKKHLIKSADDEVLEAVNNLFQKPWQERMLPQQWKTAKLKLLKKPGKPNYHNPSSYRPVTLTSVLGKCMERIIVTRLYSYVDHMDTEQEESRKFHSTSIALLRLVQNIYYGFDETDSTVGVFIDMEKDFDSV